MCARTRLTGPGRLRPPPPPPFVPQSGSADDLAQQGGVDTIIEKLGVKPEVGLVNDQADVEQRQKAFGKNTYPEPPKTTFLEYLWEALVGDVTLLILIGCAVASLAVGMAYEGAEKGWYDGVSIMAAIVAVVLITAINDYQQDLKFRDLDEQSKDIRIAVLRGGAEESVSMYELLVGDVVLLSTGDQICADGLVLDSKSLELDESSMTGESDLVKKDKTRAPFLLSGTKVADGYGRMLIVGVGTNTEWGRMMSDGADPDAIQNQIDRLEEKLNKGEISEELFEEKKADLESADEENHETPLQIRLTGLSTAIGKLGLSVAVLVFLILMIKWLVSTDGGRNVDKSAGGTIIYYIAIAVTIVVVAVPEGLPLAVTLALAYSMMKMYRDNSLVRHLKACETMGGATTICSDKTGTLTTNKMTVTEAWFGGVRCINQDITKVPELAGDVLKVFYESVFLNAEGAVYEGDDGQTVSGKPTEAAVLKYGLKAGGNYKGCREMAEVLKVDPFSSATKKMGALVQLTSGKGKAFWKGASEMVLADCTQAHTEAGVAPLEGALLAEVQDAIENMADNALRTIALAYRDVPDPAGVGEDDSIPCAGLTLIAILGIKDPCRPEVPEAVARCQDAGIYVRMVTGDNINTAKAIARECGILVEGGLAVEGAEFRAMTQSQRIARFGPKLDKLQVMARSSPSDKYDLVHMLRQLGEVVAVTGDGTNDSRALKEADIGLAMGIMGTEVAKKSSVIMDDNFKSIVTVVRWGRSIYANIQKFLVFQLTVNVVALALNFFSAVIPGAVPPLTPVQLLWVNLIMDSMGALALGTEPPTEGLMKQKPYGRTDPLITPVMWRNILGQSAFQLLALFVLVFEGHTLFGLQKAPDEHCVEFAADGACLKMEKLSEHDRAEFPDTVYLNTIIFNIFVFAQLFNELNARHLTKFDVISGVLGNRLFMAVIVVTAVLQVVLVEFGGDFSSTVPLSWQHWLITVGIGAISLPWGIGVKMFPVFDVDAFATWQVRRQNRDQFIMSRLEELDSKYNSVLDKLKDLESMMSRTVVPVGA